MRAWAERLVAFGRVHTFDYAYMASGSKRPDPLPRLVAHHAEALKGARATAEDASVFLAGKSMGGRVSCHLAAEQDTGARGVICFGYPLRSAGAGKSRAEILARLRLPVLFVQGTRDPLCPTDELVSLLPSLACPATLHLVDDGDHSLQVAKRTLARTGRTQDDVDRAIARAVGDFIAAWR